MATVAKRKWIAGAIEEPGAYRKATKTPEDKGIPAARIAADAKKGGRIGKQARLAQTLAKMRKKKEK